MLLSLITHPFFAKPRTHLIFATTILSLLFGVSHIIKSEDSLHYEAFAEKIVTEHKIDWSIPGFHGGNFFVAFIYKVTGSSLSIYWFNIICAIGTIFVLYISVEQIFKSKQLGILSVYLYLLMPMTYTSALRGFNFTPMFFFAFLGIALLWKKPKLSFLIGISYIIKPFTIAFMPLFLYKKQYKQFLLSLIFPLVYIVAEYAQQHRIMIGIHTDYTPTNLFSVSRFFINTVYGVQNYFSIHGFSPINHAYLSDMPHITPIITMLAVVAILYHRTFFKDLGLFSALAICAAIGFLLPASFFRFDYWYMTTFNFTLILLALRPMYKFYRIIPVIVLTTSFQFYYTFLEHSVYFPGYTPKIVLFGIWGLIMGLSLGYTFFRENSDHIEQPLDPKGSRVVQE